MSKTAEADDKKLHIELYGNTALMSLNWTYISIHLKTEKWERIKQMYLKAALIAWTTARVTCSTLQRLKAPTGKPQKQLLVVNVLRRHKERCVQAFERMQHFEKKRKEDNYYKENERTDY